MRSITPGIAPGITPGITPVRSISWSCSLTSIQRLSLSREALHRDDFEHCAFTRSEVADPSERCSSADWRVGRAPALGDAARSSSITPGIAPGRARLGSACGTEKCVSADFVGW